MVFGKTTSLLISFLFLFVTQLILSQEISGVILDKNTKEPLAGASIYFDNTTLGTVSNINGEFNIEYNPNIKTPLIVSFVGYKTLRFNKFDLSVTLKIYLDESEETLDEVLLTYDDGWARDLKLKEFRKHYLGESDNGKSCRILNEDDLILMYNSKKKQLTAKSKAPIFVKNNALEYLVSIEIDHFEINYSSVNKNKKRLSLYSVYYAGAYYFKSFQEEPSNEVLEKRDKAYNGSTIHFMRALAKNKLKTTGYRLFYDSFQINLLTKKYLNVTPIENSTDVFVNLKNKLSVLYRGKQRSTIESTTNPFIIDGFGNHYPIDKVKFTGHMGNQRIGDLLPLDFLAINEDEMKDEVKKL